MTIATIFYSWQSDTSAPVNRMFVEEALKLAIDRLKSDATVEPVVRETVITVDKDTEGVPGSPPIADTILRKIENCTAFVADLTLVGESLAALQGPEIVRGFSRILMCSSNTVTHCAVTATTRW